MTSAIIIGLIGLLVAAFGTLDAFANGMADTQGDGGKQGCLLMGAGTLLLVIAVVKAVAGH